MQKCTLNDLLSFPEMTHWNKFQDVEKEVIAAVLGQGLLESERLVHLLDDFKIRPEAPPKITVQDDENKNRLAFQQCRRIFSQLGECQKLATL